MPRLRPGQGHWPRAPSRRRRCGRWSRGPVAEDDARDADCCSGAEHGADPATCGRVDGGDQCKAVRGAAGAVDADAAGDLGLDPAECRRERGRDREAVGKPWRDARNPGCGLAAEELLRVGLGDDDAGPVIPPAAGLCREQAYQQRPGGGVRSRSGQAKAPGGDRGQGDLGAASCAEHDDAGRLRPGRWTPAGRSRRWCART